MILHSCRNCHDEVVWQCFCGRNNAEQIPRLTTVCLMCMKCAIHRLQTIFIWAVTELKWFVTVLF